MKSFFSWFACLIFIALGGCGALYAQDAGSGAEHRPVTPEEAPGSIATLYVLDPLANSFCFHDGKEGLLFRNHRVTRRCSDVSFSTDGRLMTGIEPDRIGSIVDLGTDEELRARYPVADIGDGRVGFASLRFHEGKLVVAVVKEDRPQERAEPLKEAQALFSTLAPSASALIALGHIYVLRVVDTKERNRQLIVKFMVIAYTPKESVTLRWQQI